MQKKWQKCWNVVEIEKIFAKEDSFVQSHLLYGIVTWGPSVSSNTLNQLQLLQNNSVRAIVVVKKSQHITSSYRDLEILKIKDLCNFEIVKLYVFISLFLPSN